METMPVIYPDYDKYDYYIVDGSGKSKLQEEIYSSNKFNNVVYITKKDEEYINKYIKDNYKNYLDMDHAPKIKVSCPHCQLNIILNNYCSKCGWILGVHFQNDDAKGDLIAHPLLNFEILNYESLIYTKQLKYNKNNIIKMKMWEDYINEN